MVHLDELQEQYRDKGLVVLALTDEPRGLVDKFVAETRAKHAIVMEEGESFKVRAFPTTYLIDVNGRIVGEGMPDPGTLQAQLAKVRMPPKLTEKLAPAQKLLDARKWGDARKFLEKAAADEKAAAEDRESAQSGVTWLDETAKMRLDDAAADALRGDPVAAAESYESIAALFKGAPAATDAETALAELMKDPARKKEIDGARKLDEMKERIAEMKPKKAIPVVKSFLNSWKGTKAADAAQKILDELTAAEAK